MTTAQPDPRLLRSPAAVAGMTLLWLLPATAWSHGAIYQLADIAPDGYTAAPDLEEVELAIEDAAREFDVPEALLQVIAHVESRWEHRPHRPSHNGRRGLFRLSPARLELAAALLGEDEDDVVSDIDLHARGFAALLDASRPMGPSSHLGAWRDALEWVFELPEAAANLVIDRWMATLDEGVIFRLDSGEPIAIAPNPIDPAYLGLYAASQGNACRSSDYPGAEQGYNGDLAPSCNYSNSSRTSGDVEYVIVHTAEGSYSGTIGWFLNCNAQVSAHYVVSYAGEITQMVLEEDIGWHVSCWNGESIGIEHEGYASSSTHPDAMYQASANLTADILADWNLPADRSVVMGHVEIDPACNYNNHWDPGPGWDWDYYMSLIGGTNTVDLTELVGYVRHTDLFEPTYGVPGAVVTVDGGTGVTADSSGYYVVDTIAPGTYTLCATASGYQQACINKTVLADVTNWGSIEIEAVTGDDDDTSGDDDVAGDDDDTSSDDDDTAGGTGDDDTSDDDDVAGGDDDDHPDDQADPADGSEVAVVGGTRHEVPRASGCRAQLSPLPAGSATFGTSGTSIALILFVLGAGFLRRRQEHSRDFSLAVRQPGRMQ